MTNQNPLYKYFRNAQIHIALPSRGQFYPEGTLDMPPNGEIPIFPMTAADEMKARTPDALFNGSAIANIISSCAPNIKDPWQMPVTDMNALLAAIRLASYGEEMEIGSPCPSCGNLNLVNVDLRSVLGSIKPATNEETFALGDLVFSFRPLTYTQLNDINRASFDNQRQLNAINSNDGMSDGERSKLLGDAYRFITDLTMRTIAATISSIKASDVLVTDTNQIYEYLMNCPKASYELIRDNSVKARINNELAPIPVVCQSCEHEYNQEFTLDISNFFETAS